MKIPFASLLYFKAIRAEAQMDWFRHSGARESANPE
jgi:hypothetical protein